MDYSTVSQYVHEYTELKHKSPFFISDWDSSSNIIVRPKTILDNSLKKSLGNIDKYFFIEDDFGKDSVIEFFKTYNVILDKNSFLVGPNASLMLTTALIALKDIGIKNVLIILPVYFSIPQILRILNINYILYETIFPNYQLNFKEIKTLIQENSIDAIFITDPFYGSGINISLEFYNLIISYLKETNIYLVIDYARGAMKWNHNNISHVFDFQLFNTIKRAKNYIFIESISKRIFVNGFKSSLLFSNYNVIQKIRKLGDCFIGSMSAGQMEFLKNLYSVSNINFVDEIIKKNLFNAQKHFELIKTLLLGTDFSYTIPTDGNYILIGIPKKHYECTADIYIFKKILYDFDIYTLPQSLYTHEDMNYYIFRVNLLLDIDKIIIALKKLLFS